MTKFSPTPNMLTLGYNLDDWHNYGIKNPITVDISAGTNSMMCLCGMSGSGKSYALLSYVAKMKLAQPDGEFFFADYKQDDGFAFMSDCKNYFPYDRSLEALDIIHNRFKARQSGKDISRNPVTLIWDEYVANILQLQAVDKKLATSVMGKVTDIILQGRSKSCKITTVQQRGDSIVYPAGSRLNFGIIVVLGSISSARSIYEMMMPEFIDEIKSKGRDFEQGEGVALLQGSKLHFIKIGAYGDFERMKQICIDALF